MSDEMKVYQTRELGHAQVRVTEVYLKKDADKRITELEETIERYKDKNAIILHNCQMVKKIAKLEKQRLELMKSHNQAQLDKADAWLRIDTLKEKVEMMKAEHCPEDDIEGISCASCDYLDKVLIILKEMKA